MTKAITFDVDHVQSKPASLKNALTPSVSNLKEPTENQPKRGVGKTKMGAWGMADIEAMKFNTTAPIEFAAPHENAFLQAALRAYDEHVPLVLAPDDVWITVAQGVTQYIKTNPEEARRAIVPFEGKQTLRVIDNSLVKGSASNEWQNVFAGFGTQIETFLGKRRDLFDPTFSTTQEIEKAAIQVQMMAALAPYFDYKCYTLCGIPNVTLLGETSDWAMITSRVKGFGEFLPKWIQEPLLWATTEFEAAANGQGNVDFWKNFAKRSGGSGGPYVNGAINAFFPYIDDKPNHMLQSQTRSFGTASWEDGLLRGTRAFGAGLSGFPSAVGSVPMEWEYHGQNLPMQLATGMFGVTVYENHGYKPVIGWAVGDRAKE